MKKCLVRIASLCLIVAFMFCVCVPVGAASVPGTDVDINASNYFSFQKIAVYPEGGGKVTIEIDVRGLRTMKELGALDLYLYEVQSDGRYTQVAHYSRDSLPSMVKSNVVRANVQVTYQGDTGKRYYAEGRCYAKDNSGSQIKWASSSIVMAT